MLQSGEIQIGKKGRMKITKQKIFQNPVMYDECFHFNADDYIFIPGRVYSSKNHERILIKKVVQSKWKCLINSKWEYVVPYVAKNENAKNYQTKKLPYYLSKKPEWIKMKGNKDFPLYVEFLFAMPNKNSWDWNNLTQLVQDVMKKAGWVPDDDVNYILPCVPQMPKLAYFIDKRNPGIYIRIL